MQSIFNKLSKFNFDFESFNLTKLRRLTMKKVLRIFFRGASVLCILIIIVYGLVTLSIYNIDYFFYLFAGFLFILFSLGIGSLFETDTSYSDTDDDGYSDNYEDDEE